MEERGQDLDAADETRPGAVEIGGAAARFYRRQLAPAVETFEPRRFRRRSLEAEAARHEHDDFRRVRAQRLPRGGLRRRALTAEPVGAAGELDHLRHPVAGGVNWIGPLDARDARASVRARRALAHAVDARAQL